MQSKRCVGALGTGAGAVTFGAGGGVGGGGSTQMRALNALRFNAVDLVSGKAPGVDGDGGCTKPVPDAIGAGTNAQTATSSTLSVAPQGTAQLTRMDLLGDDKLLLQVPALPTGLIDRPESVSHPVDRHIRPHRPAVRVRKKPNPQVTDFDRRCGRTGLLALLSG
jgi:hypothetical protein